MRVEGLYVSSLKCFCDEGFYFVRYFNNSREAVWLTNYVSQHIGDYYTNESYSEKILKDR